MESSRLLRLTAIFFAFIASAQPRFEPAAVAHVEGEVYVEEQPVAQPTTLPEGSVVRTEVGRAEIRIRGGAVYLDRNSSVRVVDNRPYNFNRFEVLSGSALVITEAGSALAACEREVTMSDAGVFRFDLQPLRKSEYGEKDCHLRIYEGAASVQLATVSVVLTRGKAMNVNRRCGDMIPSQHFDVEAIDDLDRWSRMRRADAQR